MRSETAGFEQGMTKQAAAQCAQYDDENGKVDAQVVIQLSNIDKEKYTYLHGVKA